MIAPAALASQNPRLGRSCAKIAAAAAVASGRMPSTTPPWAAGTVIIASAANSGKPSTVQVAAPDISSHRDRGGRRRRVTQRTMSPADPARAARATVRNNGSKPATASRVAGSVPANRPMPMQPSNSPSLSRDLVTRGLHPATQAPSNDLAGIKNSLWIERALERAHHLERDRILDAGQQLALHHADAVLGRNRAAIFRDDAVDERVDLVPARQERILVGADRLADVEMEIAVAEMAERTGTRAGDHGLHHRARLLEKVGHRRDRHRNVVLDRAALGFLRFRDRRAQMPERIALLETLGDDRIGNQPAVDRRFQQINQGCAQALALLRG